VHGDGKSLKNRFPGLIVKVIMRFVLDKNKVFIILTAVLKAGLFAQLGYTVHTIFSTKLFYSYLQANPNNQN